MPQLLGTVTIETARFFKSKTSSRLPTLTDAHADNAELEVLQQVSGANRVCTSCYAAFQSFDHP